MTNLKIEQRDGKDTCEITVDGEGRTCPLCEGELIPNVRHFCTRETEPESLRSILGEACARQTGMTDGTEYR